jgi:hypothetical protein
MICIKNTNLKISFNYKKMIVSLICPLFAPRLVFDKKVKKNKKEGFFSSTIEQIKEKESSTAFEDDNEEDTINERNLKNRVSLSDIAREYDTESDYLKNVFYFIKAPITKFAYHKIAFLLFLVLFSYYVLCDYPEDDSKPITWTEVILIIWVYSYFIEAVHQYYIQDTKLFFTKLKFFLSDYWNIFDLIAILVFTIGLVLRFDLNCESCLKVSK